MHLHSLGELAIARCQANWAEMFVRYPSGNLFLHEEDVSPRSCNAIGGASKIWLVNRVSVEGAPNGIGGRGSQAGSEESDGGSFGS